VIASALLQEALQKEVGMLTSLSHPNLVRFCGVCLDPPLLVMEYYRHGSVFGMLDRARRQLVKCRAAGQQQAAGAGANQKVWRVFQVVQSDCNN
jgi:serine/threonine protein kinase